MMETLVSKKIASRLGIILALIVGLIGLWGNGGIPVARAAEPPAIEFFYSVTCPHCQAEQRFLDLFEKRYPQVPVRRYEAARPENQRLLTETAARYPGADRYLGLVPLTFVGDEYFLGFAADIGEKIEASVRRQWNMNGGPETSSSAVAVPQDESIFLPLIGSIDPRAYSLPVLAVVLGTLDGFNICSLGALILILGLVLKLRSRSTIILYGGVFLITTAIVYGILILAWYKLFALFASYLRLMELLIGFIAALGGIYFFREYMKFREHGPVCETSNNRLVAELSAAVQKAFRNPKGALALAGSIGLFAAVVAIVEFPCSAAIPVVFAGMLAKANLPPLIYGAHIGLFLLFYLLDEILIFGIAVWKLTVWLGSSPRFVTGMTLTQAIILFVLGMYYLGANLIW